MGDLKSTEELRTIMYNLLMENYTLKEKLENLTDVIEGIISESYGVSGYHLNGDTAKWSEFTNLLTMIHENNSHISHNYAEHNLADTSVEIPKGRRLE